MQTSSMTINTNEKKTEIFATSKLLLVNIRKIEALIHEANLKLKNSWAVALIIFCKFQSSEYLYLNF